MDALGFFQKKNDVIDDDVGGFVVVAAVVVVVVCSDEFCCCIGCCCYIVVVFRVVIDMFPCCRPILANTLPCLKPFTVRPPILRARYFFFSFSFFLFFYYVTLLIPECIVCCACTEGKIVSFCCLFKFENHSAFFSQNRFSFFFFLLFFSVKTPGHGQSVGSHPRRRPNVGPH